MLQQLLEEREQWLLGPVQILQHDRPGRRAEARLQVTRHPERELAAAKLRREIRRLTLRTRERERRELPHDSAPLLLVEAGQLRDSLLDLCSRVVEWIGRRYPGFAADELLQWPVRDRAAVWEARHPCRRLGAEGGEELAVLRVLFETGSDYDGASGDEGLRPLEITRYYFAGIDPDTKRETWAAVRARGRDLVSEGECRADGAVSVILVRGGNAEHGHDGIPDELLDRGAVGLEDLARPGERARQCGAEDLGVVRARAGARIDDVREQDRHDLPLLRHDRSLGAGCMRT